MAQAAGFGPSLTPGLPKGDVGAAGGRSASASLITGGSSWQQRQQQGRQAWGGRASPPGPGYCRCQTAGCYELCGGSVSVAMAADLFYFSQLPPLRAPSKKHPPRAPTSSPALRAPHGGAASPRCPRGTSTSSPLRDEALGTRPGARGQRQVMLEAPPRCPNVGAEGAWGCMRGCPGAGGAAQELPRAGTGRTQPRPRQAQRKLSPPRLPPKGSK